MSEKKSKNYNYKIVLNTIEERLNDIKRHKSKNNVLKKRDSDFRKTLNNYNVFYFCDMDKLTINDNNYKRAIRIQNLFDEVKNGIYATINNDHQNNPIKRVFSSGTIVKNRRYN